MSFAAISLANRPLTENRLNKHKQQAQQAQQALSAVSQAYKGLEERQVLLAIGIHFHFHSVVTTPSSPKTSPEQSSSSLIPRCSSSPSPSSQALPRPMSLREPLAPHQCARESPSPATTPSSSTPPSTARTTWPSPTPPPPTHTRYAKHPIHSQPTVCKWRPTNIPTDHQGPDHRPHQLQRNLEWHRHLGRPAPHPAPPPVQASEHRRCR